MDTNLNYFKIVKFSLILFVSLVIASTAVTFVFSSSNEQLGIQFWVTQYILSFSVSLIAYIFFARQQNSKHYKFAVLIASFYWVINVLIGLVMNLLWGVPALHETIAIELAITVVAVPLGTFIGLKSSRSNFR